MLPKKTGWAVNWGYRAGLVFPERRPGGHFRGRAFAAGLHVGVIVRDAPDGGRQTVGPAPGCRKRSFAFGGAARRCGALPSLFSAASRP
jgi:hypothetical protein